MIVDEKNFSELLTAGLPLVVDCSATWCGPCKMMHPVVEAVAEEYLGRVNIGFLDIDDCPDFCDEFGITSVPTVLYFRDGKLVDRTVGALPKDALMSHIAKIL